MHVIQLIKVRSASKGWISEQSKESCIMGQSIDQGVIEGAMIYIDDTYILFVT